jgi:hypothetical protein
MKPFNHLALLTLITTLATWAGHAQELVGREEAVRLAVRLNFDLSTLADCPIPTDADTKRPFAIKAGERGGMVVPESKLSAAGLEAAGKTVVPVGQFWMRKLAPAKAGQAPAPGDLKIIRVEHQGQTEAVLLFTLGARRNAEGKLELLVFGKGPEPLVTTPLKAVETKQEWPLEFTAEKSDDSAVVTLKVAGKYQAAFTVLECNAE